MAFTEGTSPTEKKTETFFRSSRINGIDYKTLEFACLDISVHLSLLTGPKSFVVTRGLRAEAWKGRGGGVGERYGRQ